MGNNLGGIGCILQFEFDYDINGCMNVFNDFIDSCGVFFVGGDFL